MKSVALAGAIALALTASFSIANSSTAAAQTVASRTGIVLTETHIAYFRQALRLTPAQEPYWAPVEAALRGLTQPQGRSPGGLAGLASDANTLRRITAIAMPLLRVLDPTQKRNGIAAARAMGFGHLAAAL